MAVDTGVAQQVGPRWPLRWRPSTAGWTARFGVLGAIGAALLLLVGTIDDFQANRIAFAAIFAVVGLSMNMLMGYGGQISLGHQAFVGIGAFASGYIVTNMGLPFAFALVGAALSGGLSALVLGGVALRVRGLYLALVTLAYGAVAERTIFLFRPLTGGGSGLPAPRPTFAEGDAAYAYFCLAMLGAVLAFDWRFMKTKAGRAVQAIRDSERVAASMGINVMGYKLLGFVLSGLMAGLGGGLLAHQALVVVAAPFSFFLALEFVLMTVVGGLGSRVGVVLGSAFFALLDKFIPSDYALWVPAIGAGLLIITLIQFPGGIGQQIRPITLWFSGHKFDLHAIKEGTSAAAVGGGQDVRP
jgi:branched-chain amino acid transport system permease protein